MKRKSQRIVLYNSNNHVNTLLETPEEVQSNQDQRLEIIDDNIDTHTINETAINSDGSRTDSSKTNHES